MPRACHTLIASDILELEPLDDDVFEVDRCLDIRRELMTGEWLFRISWIGYGPEHDSWLYLHGVDNCHDLIWDYWRENYDSPHDCPIFGCDCGCE